MWRGDLKNDNMRIDKFLLDYKRIGECVNDLKNKNEINDFYFFPYTMEFAKICIDLDYFDGIIVYRNPVENQYDDMIKSCKSKNKKCITIRPFQAGKSIKNDNNCQELLDYAFNIDSIYATITSISKEHQLIFN